MKQLDLTLAPSGFFLWRYPQSIFSAPHCLSVPAGMEAVLVRDGEPSDPYRAGDTLKVGRRRGFFRQRAARLEEVFLCRKDLPTPLRWGLGGMPSGAQVGGDVSFGASGSLRLSVANARLLVRQLAVGQESLDEKALGRRLEPLIVESIRPTLIEAVNRIGIRDATARLNSLSANTAESIRPYLFELGLGLESLTVETLISR